MCTVQQKQNSYLIKYYNNVYDTYTFLSIDLFFDGFNDLFFFLTFTLQLQTKYLSIEAEQNYLR